MGTCAPAKGSAGITTKDRCRCGLHIVDHTSRTSYITKNWKLKETINGSHQDGPIRHSPPEGHTARNNPPTPEEAGKVVRCWGQQSKSPRSEGQPGRGRGSRRHEAPGPRGAGCARNPTWSARPCRLGAAVSRSEPHLAAAHGEFHVRSGCDSPWRDTSGEHSNRRTSVPFRANAAGRVIVPHVAADADDAPRRGSRQTHTRPVALVPRPAAASERNVSQPDGVRLTPPWARCQVRREAVA